MPAPDVARPDRVDAKSVLLLPAVTTAVSVLTCDPNKIVRLRNVTISNPSASAVVVTLYVMRGITIAYIAPGITLPAKASFQAVVATQSVHMEAGDTLYFQVGTANTCSLLVAYEVVT